MAPGNSNEFVGSLLLYSALSAAATIILKIIFRKLDSRNAKPTPDTEEEERLRLEARKPALLWNTAMFFPDYHPTDPDSTFQQFLWYFAQARLCIRICIYNFSIEELEYILCQKYEQGLCVHLIVGKEEIANRLRPKSLPCGVVPKSPNAGETDELMHHKFAIIDDEAVLVGSMNYTFEAINCNRENICVSTNPQQVQVYLVEFCRLLRRCEDANTYY